MKIASWNCGGALRKKLDQADSLSADILIIQECEDPARSTHAYREWAGNYLWLGDSKNKGIGIFPKNGHRVTALNWSGKFEIAGIKHPSGSWTTEALKLFLPFSINDDYKVLGVWTKGADSQAFAYIGQLWKYLQIHRQQLSGPRQLIMGDLNSNAIWDKSDRWWNHSNVIEELAELGLSSVYHWQHGENQGEESLATFFLYRRMAKAYHIDYAFASKDLLDRCTLDVGIPEDWLTVSDHVPITLKLDTA
ncbi:endonuclease/exonuclease/phosphatase family protein [Leucothrix mucor]|uniref:endonuclease/exonuclease/phosphatase family protein n=1 Tax=Leucothrix mucor TaxID=45248 RepID=UPI0003B71B90|nr:endonuclease/exonuclease/phosphatase family protein [Leucothrix mucor]